MNRPAGGQEACMEEHQETGGEEEAVRGGGLQGDREGGEDAVCCGGR